MVESSPQGDKTMKRRGIGTFVAFACILALMVTLGVNLAQADHGGIAQMTQAARENGFAVPEGAAAILAPTMQAAPATGGGPTVAITSFVAANDNTPVSEICGKVTGATSEFSVVRILVDPKSKTPGFYNTVAGSDGAFCAVVMTWQGTATASVQTLSKEVTSRPATVSHGNPRP
jgi:hypothetical protein